MAAETDVIRAFLVSLGFKIDEPGAKKFDNALDRTTKVAFTAGKTILGIGIAAQAMVAAYAASMEKLYYASRRTGASVENIQALEYGSKRIGIAAGVAQEALEQMASAVRTNPGLRGLMDRIVGHSTEGMDQAKVMIELVQKLSSMPHYVGAQFAGMFGMDEKTFLMMKQGMPELLRAEEDRIALNRRLGIDAQAAAEASKEYANSLRELGAHIEAAGAKLSIKLLPYFRQFNEIAEELVDHISDINLDDVGTPSQIKQIGELRSAFGELVDATKDLAKTEEMSNFFSNVKNMANEASTGIAKVVTGLLQLATFQGAKGGGNLWEGFKTVVKNSPGSLVLRGAFDWINRWRDGDRDPNSPDSAYNDESPAERARRKAGKAGPAAAPATAAAAATGSRGLRTNNPGNLRFARQAGATDVGGFASFGSSGEGIYALANQLALYNERGLNTLKTIISTYAPSSENNTEAYIADVAKRIGAAPGEKLDLKDPEVLSKLMAAVITHENGRNPFDTTQLLSAAQARVGEGSGVVITQKTDIHVSGAGSAAATGAAVAQQQQQVNATLVRNMQGATQ